MTDVQETAVNNAASNNTTPAVSEETEKGKYTMSPKKMVAKDNAKRKKDTISIEMKIIGKHEHGLRVADLTKLYSRSSSTICTILKKKEEIKKLDVAKGVTMIIKQRSNLIEDVETLLLVCINKK